MGDKVIASSGNIKDPSGNLEGTFTTENDGGHIIVTGEIVFDLYWVPSILMPGGMYFDTGNSETAHVCYVFLCIESTIDQCIKWAYSAWYRNSADDPWSVAPDARGRFEKA